MHVSVLPGGKLEKSAQSVKVSAGLPRRRLMKGRVKCLARNARRLEMAAVDGTLSAFALGPAAPELKPPRGRKQRLGSDTWRLFYACFHATEI